MNGGGEKVSIGKLQGQVSSGFESFFDERSLADFGERVRTANEGVLSEGRHRVVVIPFERDGQELKIAVKAFGKQSQWKDRYDFKKGSKAERSFRSARFLKDHDVGTPEPIAYFDCWNGSRLMESFFLSAYVESLTSFKGALLSLYRKNGDCRFIVERCRHIALAIRDMHDAGFWHRDLGNQNMEFQIDGDGEWGEVQFIDLNRGRIKDELSAKERAQDFSRIRLPSAFLDVLVRIYWGGDPPQEFVREMARRRRRFERWERSRKWRHPFRKGSRGPDGDYPEVQDIWIWDRESAQAAITMERYERKRHYPRGRHAKVAGAVLKSGRKIWREYKKQLPLAYANRVELKGRFGMALESTELDFDRQFELLDELSGMPVLLRFCHHEGRARWQAGIAQVKRLKDAGRDVMIAMVQDRRAVKEPESWAGFLKFVLGEVSEMVTQVEICHAMNRMKWGVHGPDDQLRLLEPVVELQKQYPEIIFTGPACIDFEYHYVLSALEGAPDGLRYGALSHHLYVDRRGAPENFQGKFSTLEKCALLRAIAKVMPQCDDRVVISEVNWPLEGTGVWSPVTATYNDPDTPEHPLSVSEFDYGVFMLRYLVIAVCSGFVEQVYWWRLVAHGFGLVDERAGDGRKKRGGFSILVDERSPEGWRERPAFAMLRTFLKELGEATFVERLELGREVYALRFKKDGGQVTLMWCNRRTYAGPWPVDFDHALDAFGNRIELVEVGESPVYLNH